MERDVLALVIRKELIEHSYPPEGLRFVETGDVVGEASYNGEMNAVFRTSGFSVLSNGEWSSHLWEDVEKPLGPPPLDPSVGLRDHPLLRVQLKNGEIVSFEMDHFWGYYSLFLSVTRWFRTGSDADWWKRLEKR